MSSNGHAKTTTATATMTAEAEPINLLPEARHYQLRGGLPNTPLSVSLISALLGGLLFGSLALAAGPWLVQASQGWSWARPQLGVYMACMGLFHLCEFWTTAGWNAQKLSVDGEQMVRLLSASS